MFPQTFSQNKPITVAVLGASGAVGQELLALLEERCFPLGELRLLGSSRSAGSSQIWKGVELKIQEVNLNSFEGVDLVLASAGGSVSRKWRPAIQKAGALMIDNSSAFRMDQDVPLVVPEVNPQALDNHQGVIANPNCTTILLALTLAPLAKVASIRRVLISTYQSASGAGAKAMDELKQLTKAVLEDSPRENSVLPYSLAFNLFLHNSPMQSNGYCEEEMKMVNETRKIMEMPDLPLSATCVRVPVLRAHSEAVNVEFLESFSVQKAKEIFLVFN